MPTADSQASIPTLQAVIVRSTTTAEILDVGVPINVMCLYGNGSINKVCYEQEHRFSMLDRSPHNGSNDYDLTLQSIKKQNDDRTADMEMKLLNTSSGTSVSEASTPSSSASPKKDNVSVASSSASSIQRRKNTEPCNQGDVNSIESISESTYPTLAVCNKHIRGLEVEWVDDITEDNHEQLGPKQQKYMHEDLREPYCRVTMKKQKKQERDQLDGVKLGLTKNDDDTKKFDNEKDDEKVVKCLYYTLMCCDCTIC